MGKENKSSNAEFEKRVGIVAEMLLSGLSRRQILQNIATNPKLQWDVIPRQIDNYIAKANEEIQARFEDDKAKMVLKASVRYDFLYQKLVSQKKYKDAVTPLDKLCELAGIKVIKTDVTSKGEAVQTQVIVNFKNDGKG